MKHILRVPTGPDYAYIEAEFEGESDGAVVAYLELTALVKGEAGSGLVSKDWCRFLDCYLGEGKPPEDGMSLWQDMSTEQRHVVNEVKKAFARIERKNGAEKRDYNTN